jgi:hypothetical protein
MLTGLTITFLKEFGTGLWIRAKRKKGAPPASPMRKKQAPAMKPMSLGVGNCRAAIDEGAAMLRQLAARSEWRYNSSPK